MALKEQITKLQAENKTTSDKYAADLKELKLNTAIKLAVTGDAHDPDMITGLLDKTKLALAEDGKLSGLDDQIKSLRESKAFLFAEKTDTKQFTTKGIKPGESNAGGGTATAQSIIEQQILGGL
ncbi:Phage minor structural protein GP20 [compost metagenome]